MHPYTRSMVTEPAALDEDSRRSFGEKLYATHLKIFEDVDFEDFYRYVVDSRALRTHIQTYFNRAGDLVGYCAMHIFERDLEGREVRVYRIETGLLPAYRGRALCANFLAREFATALLSAGRKENYFFGCLVHPSSYCGLSRHLDRIWPHPERPTPPEIAEFMGALADDFGLPSVVARDPLVRKVGWVTRESPGADERWRQSADPRVRLYLRRNPDYRAGVGMSTMIPITGRSVVSWFTRNALHKLRRRLRESWLWRPMTNIRGWQSRAPRRRCGSGPCPGAAR